MAGEEKFNAALEAVQISKDIRPEEDFSPQGIIARTMEENERRDTYAFYRDLENATDDPILGNVRAALRAESALGTGAGVVSALAGEPDLSESLELSRYRRASAIQTIASRVPKTLEKYPSIVQALAEAPDIDPEDVRNLINVMELENAFNVIGSLQDPIAQRNVLLSMTDIQRAAFLDFVPAKLEELKAEAEKDPAFFSRLWNFWYGSTIEPVFNAIVWTGDKFQQGLRANMYAAGVRDPSTAIPLVGPALTTFKYWDKVESGDYDENYLNQLRAEYDEKYPGAVDSILRLEEYRRDGLPEPDQRFLSEIAGTPQAYLARSLIYSPTKNPELLELARKINSAHFGDTAMIGLALVGAPGRGTETYEDVAGVLNATATVALDPTLMAGKGVAAYRAARYGLMKLSTAATAEKAFQMRSVRRWFDNLGRDIDRLQNMKASDRARARDILSSQYGKILPDDVLDDMIAFTPEGRAGVSGVRNADDAREWYMAGFKSSEIIDGKPATFNPWFDRIYSTTQLDKRLPYLPHRSFLGAWRAQARVYVALHNPLSRLYNDHFEKTLAASFESAQAGRAGAVDVALVLDSEDLSYAKSVGIRARRPDGKPLLRERIPGRGLAYRINRSYANRYVDLSIPARIDRVARAFAKMPLQNRVYLNDGRDAKAIYNWARVFLPRHHATFIADAWRNAATASERKLIFNGLMRTTGAASGVTVEGLKAVVPELMRGAKYTPTTVQRKLDNGQLVKVDETAEAVDPIDVENLVQVSESLYNGRDMPLHLYQAADYVGMPNLSKMKEYGAKASIISGLFGPLQGLAATGLVDYWSLLNLAGPRYFIRNFIEDFAMYALTGGRLDDYWKGRRGATATRVVRGQKLGIVNRALYAGRKDIELTGDPADNSLWSIIKSGFTDKDLAEAQAAMRDGNFKKMRELMAISLLRQKVTGFTEENVDDFLDFVTDHGFSVLDEAIEGSGLGASGTAENLWTQRARADIELADGPDGSVLMARIVYPQDEFVDINVKPVSNQQMNPLRFSSWQRAIIGVTQADGILGDIAVANLDRPDGEIIPLLVRALDDDTVYKYKERLARFYQHGQSSEQFVRSYLADVRNMFSDSNGNLIRSVWEGVTRVDPETGIRTVVKRAKGEDFPVTVADLRAVPEEMLPEEIVGRKVELTIPMPKDAQSLITADGIWRILGEQYSRISREPIFFAHYLRQRQILRPYENTLAAEHGSEFARRQVSKIATDRAYGMILSYTDNPLDRTMLAWNVRNVARYYRATEDFARRLMRLSKNYPTGIVKAGLLYEAMEDTGFIHTDSNGEKYYIYPGSQQLLSAVSWTLKNVLGQESLTIDAGSFSLRGNVRMSAPSLDPATWLPTISSPLSGMAVKSVVNAFPALQSFEQAIAGEYSEYQSFWDALMPGHIKRVFSTLNTNVEERYSMYSSIFKDAVAITAAAGKLPAPAATIQEVRRMDDGSFAATVWAAGEEIYVSIGSDFVVGGLLPSMPKSGFSNQPITNEERTSLSYSVADKYYGDSQAEKDEYIANLKSVTTTLMVARALGSFFLPAVGQITSEDITDYARRGGYIDMSDLWRGMIRKAVEEGSVNPAADALADFVSLFGTEATPFTISSTASNDTFDSLNQLTSVLATKEGEAWIKENPDLTEKYPTGSAFLLPRVGEYSHDMARWLLNAGLKIPRSAMEVYNKASTIRAEYTYYSIRDAGESLVAEKQAKYLAAFNAFNAGGGSREEVDAAYAEVKNYEKKLEQAVAEIKFKFPAIRTVTYNLNADQRQRLIDTEIRPMLRYVYEDRSKPVEPTINNIAQALSTFDTVKSLINRIVGSTKADDEQKRVLKIELRQSLNSIASRDRNTKFFVETILLPLVDRAYDPTPQQYVDGGAQ